MEFKSKNKKNLLTNCKFIETKKNIGRIKNRVLLAESAQYDWVIFIDVDTTPSDYFLMSYIELIDKNSIIFGGCFFDKPKVSENNYLRLKICSVAKIEMNRHLLSTQLMLAILFFLSTRKKIFFPYPWQQLLQQIL